MASVIVSPNLASASALNFCKTIAKISAGCNHLSPILISTPPSEASLIS